MRMRNRTGSIRRTTGFTACLMALMNLIACTTSSRHRVIVYDHSWSSAAAVKNLWCAPQLRKACAQQATVAEQDFTNRLPRAFSEEPACANVSFVVYSTETANTAELENKLKMQVSVYWRLRVDFRPGLPRQPFTLGAGEETPLIEGDDTEHNASLICTAAKHNGVIDYW
jgi:hypothetical protein